MNHRQTATRPLTVRVFVFPGVRLLDVTGPVIRFAGVDRLDGTPVIDLKPYVARFDRPPGEPRCGWYDQVPIRDGVSPANGD